jgi:oligoribonuclease NrnB/cAMP/cGMP phosphodiesterase (DHH superfamily)
MSLLPPPESDVSIIYHGDCQDGFASAFAAWKRYGDAAMYTPNEHGNPYKKEAVVGKNIVMIDFSFKKPVLDEIASLAKSLTILDHHESAKDAVTSLPSSLYSDEHSGAFLAWHYFHPEKPVPKLILYIEDDDLFRFKLPDSRAIREYVFVKPFDFKIWDDILNDMETPEGYQRIVQTGTVYREYAESVVSSFIARAETVSFEGYEVLAVSAPRLFDSEVGNRLARIKPPFALVFKFQPGRTRVSLRGDGSIDVSKIAAKYGGGGHFSAAGFTIDNGTPLPFRKV